MKRNALRRGYAGKAKFTYLIVIFGNNSALRRVGTFEFKIKTMKTIARHKKKKDALLGLTKKAKGNENDESTDETKVDRLLKTLYAEDSFLDVSENFLKHHEDYEKSSLVKLLRNMPKGAHLHLHNLSGGCFRKFSKYIVQAPNLYADENKNFAFHKPENAKKLGLKKCSSFIEDEVYNLITMPTKKNILSRKELWVHFAQLWERILLLTFNTYFYDGPNSFFYEMLEDQYKNGIRYLELRNGAGDVYANELGEPVTAKQYLLVVNQTVKVFQKKYSDFIGCKIIPCGHKGQDNAEIESQVKLTLKLKKDKEVGNMIAGFDLVGEEDTLHPLESYIHELKIACKNDVPLLLHAGETNNSDRTCLYDAYLLGARRIGHGYDIINHPVLMEKFVQDKVYVECCPLSNDCLGYLRDMRNHSGKTMIANGIKLTISSDDPGMFHYHDVTYDWAVVAKAWNLSLLQLKELALNSLDGAILSDEVRKKAKLNFHADWRKFIQDTLTKNSKNLTAFAL